MHVALGLEWNHCKVNQAPVLYVAGEGGIGIPRRIKALADRYNNGQMIDNLYRLDFPVIMNDLIQVEQLSESIRAESERLGKKFGLVIIDTLARCFGAADEKRSDDMNRFVAACDRIKAQTSSTILVVHHSGAQSKERARGSSALRAASDFEYRVERAAIASTGLVLTCTKSKDDRVQPAQMFELREYELFTDDDGEAVTSLVCDAFGQEPPAEGESEGKSSFVPGKNHQAVLQAIRSRIASGVSTGYKVIRDDLAAQGIKVDQYCVWIAKLVEEGLIERIDGDESVLVNCREPDGEPMDDAA